jgi:hypothetical protein
MTVIDGGGLVSQMLGVGSIWQPGGDRRRSLRTGRWAQASVQ